MKWRIFFLALASLTALGLGQELKMDNNKRALGLVNSLQPPDVSASVSGRITAKSLGLSLDEQAKIAKSISAINGEWSESFWETLVTMSSDERYCITVLNDNEFAENWSVGKVCGFFAKSQITDSIRECLESISVDVTKEHVGYRMDFFSGQAIRVWREDRKHKRYNELQLELVEVAISQLISDKAVSDSQKELALNGLKKLRRRFERTVQPGFVRVAFIGEKYSLPR